MSRRALVNLIDFSLSIMIKVDINRTDSESFQSSDSEIFSIQLLENKSAEKLNE